MRKNAARISKTVFHWSFICVMGILMFEFLFCRGVIHPASSFFSIFYVALCYIMLQEIAPVAGAYGLFKNGVKKTSFLRYVFYAFAISMLTAYFDRPGQPDYITGAIVLVYLAVSVAAYATYSLTTDEEDPAKAKAKTAE